MSSEDVQAPTALSTPMKPRAIDSATILGLVAGFGFVLVAIFLGGTPESFLDARSTLIVLGGTFAVTAISFSMNEISDVFAAFSKAFTRNESAPRDIALRMIRLAGRVRRDPNRAVENELSQFKSAPFLSRGLGLVADDTPVEDIESLLSEEVSSADGRNRTSVLILQRASEVAPAMGLIGTLVGLVQMLGGLNEPDTIGPGMALALLTTFYGAVLGNMVFAPLSSKLERRAIEDRLSMSIYAISILSIARKENPRRLEMRLNTMLPPQDRLHYFK